MHYFATQSWQMLKRKKSKKEYPSDRSRCLSNGICRSDWKTDKYFSMYYNTFTFTTTWRRKLEWCNRHFYSQAHSIEREKLLYFGLVYRQNTLVINAPNDSTKQKEFLGYDWSNRKGNEGIQIINQGGKLYSPNDRQAEDKLSSLIRNAFLGKQYICKECENYARYLRLRDMFDFLDTTFLKSIRTTSPRTTDIQGFVVYKLLKLEAQERLDKLYVEREELIDKYFVRHQIWQYS